MYWITFKFVKSYVLILNIIKYLFYIFFYVKKNTFKTLYRLRIKKNEKEGGKRTSKKQKEPLFTIITVVLNQENI